jgi:hypothetical protein
MAVAARPAERRFTSMIALPFGALLLALASAPWAHPLSFRPLPGWHTGASGDTRSVYVGHRTRVAAPLESAAWIARNVDYRDDATADPPNTTLSHLPANGLIVWAVIFAPAESGQKPLRLNLADARHLKCCDGPVTVAGGQYELTGTGSADAYSVIVRIYFGSRPTGRLRAQAQRALNQLELPAAR